MAIAYKDDEILAIRFPMNVRLFWWNNKEAFLFLANIRTVVSKKRNENEIK